MDRKNALKRLMRSLAGLARAARAFAAPLPRAVTLVRVPNGGIQPQAVVDSSGVLHLVYLHGDLDAENICCVYKPLTGNQPFSAPLRVNSVPGSATAAGSIRGAQIAVGRQSGISVVWNGPERPRRRSIEV
jgi:hypothetical protein